jgi:hypothetical protein
MKYAVLMVLMFCKLAASSTASDFLTFRPATVQKFRLPEAQALADAERMVRYGACGMSVFKEKKGDLWVFETRVGYAGSPAADIIVIPPSSAFPSFLEPQKEANQPPQPTLTIRPFSIMITPLQPPSATLGERG